ncbi:Pycsar system effector family protein [Streptomyces lavendulocolor]|uniref:Pycsar system effector family protein n=1 Tax=Streptomyces lavendulocolor TaxID=67316 RepID=UPI003C2B8477
MTTKPITPADRLAAAHTSVLVEIIGRALPAPAAVFIGAGAVALVAAMLLVLVVVRPRVDGTPRGSYLHWAQCTPDEVLADLAEPTGQAGI